MEKVFRNSALNILIPLAIWHTLEETESSSGQIINLHSHIVEIFIIYGIIIYNIRARNIYIHAVLFSVTSAMRPAISRAAQNNFHPTYICQF